MKIKANDCVLTNGKLYVAIKRDLFDPSGLKLKPISNSLCESDIIGENLDSLLESGAYFVLGDYYDSKVKQTASVLEALIDTVKFPFPRITFVAPNNGYQKVLILGINTSIKDDEVITQVSYKYGDDDKVRTEQGYQKNTNVPMTDFSYLYFIAHSMVKNIKSH